MNDACVVCFPVFPAAVYSFTVCGIMMKKKLLSIAALFAASSLQAEPQELGTVVVSATRTEQSEISTPASITVIGREEIENSQAQNIAEVLRARGGVHITDFYGDGSRVGVDMRGFGATASENTLIMVDGRRLNTIDLSAPVLSSISLQNVERIEIVQGSAGTLYGDQAVGGVINIITRTPRDFSAQVQAGVGSYNNRQLFANVSDALDNGIDYRLSGDVMRSDNYREHNEVERHNVLGMLGYSYNAGRVFVELQDVYEDLNTPGALTDSEAEADPQQSLPVYAGDFTETASSIGRLGLKQDIGSHWLFEAEYTYRDEDSDSITSSRLFGPSTDLYQIERERQELTPRFTGFFDNRFGEMQFTLGYDYFDVDYRSQYGAFSPNTIEQQTSGLYGQAVLPFYTGWSLTLGGRQADWENDYVYAGNTGKKDDSLSVFTAGLQYRPTVDWRLFLRADENYRFPTTDEFTWTSPGVELETQTGISYELGAEWQQQLNRAKFVVYQLDQDNEIGYDPNAPDPFGGFGANVNFDKTERTGVIIEGDHMLASNFRVAGVYNYVKARFVEGPYSGERVPGVPRDSFKIMTDYDFAKNWHWFFEGNYVGKQYLSGDFANDQGWQAGYAVLNTSIDYRWKGLKLSARINNLADKQYAEIRAWDQNFGRVLYPSPGRNYWLTASYDF
jgi:iron complex outermembrane receptor protein